MQDWLKQQDYNDLKHSNDQLISLQVNYERVISSLKDENKELRNKLQHEIELNLDLDQELKQNVSKVDSLKKKREADNTKYKSALSCLKNKSSDKIASLKEKLKEKEKIQYCQQEELDDLKELLKEQESQFYQLQQMHKSALKQIEMDKLMKEETFNQERQQVNEECVRKIEYMKQQMRDQEYKQDELEQRIQKEVKEKVLLEEKLEQQSEIKFQQESQLKCELDQLNLKLLNQNQQIRAQQDELIQQDIYIKDYEQEINQLKEIINKIQNQLNIEIKGTYSYQQIASELENKQEFLSKENQNLTEQMLQKDQSLRKYQLQIEQDKLTIIQQEEKIVRYERENDKQNNEFSLLQERQKIENKEINELKNEQFTLKEQLSRSNELIKEQNQQLYDQDRNIKQLEQLLDQEKYNHANSISKLNNEKYEWKQKYQNLKYKLKSFKSKQQKVLNKQIDQFYQQLKDVKLTLMNKVKMIESDFKIGLQHNFKKYILNIDKKIKQQDEDNYNHRNEQILQMEQQLEKFKLQYQRSEQQMIKDYEIQLKQKQSTIDNLNMQIVRLQEKITNLNQMNQEVQQLKYELKDTINEREQLYISNNDKISELKQEHGQEIYSLHQEIKELTTQLDICQINSNEILKKHQKEHEIIIRQLQRKAELQIDDIKDQYEKRFQEFRHQMLQESNHIIVSPQKTFQQSTKFSNILTTPNDTNNKRPPMSDNKSIEQLRREISAQKSKLSRMKLTFSDDERITFQPSSYHSKTNSIDK